MVTGDNKDTARAIAKECGILTSADDDNVDSVMEGIKKI
jgi:magnesium-transporting ATPase (P-type)